MVQRRFQFPATALAAGALFLICGCAAALQANKRSPGKIENGEFKPELPPAANYGADPKLTCPQFGPNGALEEELDRRGGKRAKQDGRLCAIADTLLGWKPGAEGELPPESIRSFVSQYFGVPGVVRRMLISDVQTDKPKEVAAAVADSVSGFAGEVAQPIYGMMTERVKKGVTHVVVVYFDDVAQIDPLPRRIAANGTATLSGTLVGNFTKPRLEVVDAQGKLTKTPEQPGNAFRTELKCGEHPGKILVQIVAEKEGSDTAVTNFPVWCEAQPAVAVKVPVEGAAEVDLAAAEKQLVEMLNADRTTAGLKPVNSLPALADIARHIAENRAAGKGLTSSELTQALKDADIAAPLILESMAQGFTIDDAYTRFSESPGDRANTLNGEITDVGVGVAKGPVVGKKPTYIVAELFVKQRAPIDPEKLKASLYEAIDKKRSDARAPALAHDKTLEGVAQAYAEAAAANQGRPPKEKENEILAPLYKESMTVNQLGGFLPDEKIALDVAEQPAIVGNAKLVGVGVAIGRSPQFGKGSPFVMVFLGTRHQAPKAVRRRPARHK